MQLETARLSYCRFSNHFFTVFARGLFTLLRMDLIKSRGCAWRFQLDLNLYSPSFIYRRDYLINLCSEDSAGTRYPAF
jgi:hypothetical protein